MTRAMNFDEMIAWHLRAPHRRLTFQTGAGFDRYLLIERSAGNVELTTVRRDDPWSRALERSLRPERVLPSSSTEQARTFERLYGSNRPEDQAALLEMIQNAVATASCPRDGLPMHRIQNPRNPSLGEELFCDCAFRISV